MAGAAGTQGQDGTGAPLVLVVDDQPRNLRLLADLLQLQGCRTLCATRGAEALALARQAAPDLVLLDVLMPDLDGVEVCRQLRADAAFAATPIVMITSLEDRHERIRALDAGADDFLTKPVRRDELQARVRSLLRVKRLYDEVARQRGELAQWAATLERRVAEKVAEVERLARLKRFFSPALAARLVGAARDDALRSHRGEVSVLFADLRGFTAFAETSPPERVMALLREFHAEMGRLIFRWEGTLERFTGDGMMVFFNDPEPMPDHVERAVRLGLQMSAVAAALGAGWRRDGGPDGLAVGIAEGVATLGPIGFESRLDYAAIGSVTNLAARLCAEARAGEVLVTAPVWQAVRAWCPGDGRGEPLALKGFATPVQAVRLRPGATSSTAARAG